MSTLGALLFGMLPIALWAWLSRSPRTGVAVGAVLVALLAWFVVPRALWASGPWVPSEAESYWLYAVFAAIVCVIGVLVQRQWPRGLLRLVAVAGLGVVIAFVVEFGDYEAKPGDEGVLPAPAGVRVVEGQGHCGSGSCAREVTATGDRAAEALREHLASRGFSARPPLNGGERRCRAVGLLVVREVCAELRSTGPDLVEVTWYVNRAPFP
ncbi:hypothetical protein [Lentzea jiangxiensis]|uniref:Uncharacterized protein n=1 Tax=Lentzea jiangxiensis TaxID=641025 RepID=A0A1H0ULQ4_9PSEU|nr:hypothetical protein [Lentzea jiangxiensis]SDP67129.1 hypothetical protein SAMN05421507_112103 [Lentzea jiangxiensis]